MVSIAEANELGKDMIDQHLHGMGYRLAWDRSTKRGGACNYRLREIVLSTWAVESYSWDEFERLMLHEIAHALTESETTDHGPRWKKTCRELGGDASVYCRRFVAKRVEITPVGLISLAAAVYTFAQIYGLTGALVSGGVALSWLARRIYLGIKPAGSEHGMKMVDGEWVTP